MRNDFGVFGFLSGLNAILYKFIFHKEMSEEIKNFTQNLSYMTIGIAFATIFDFTFNIIAGRSLGPAEYGEFTLIQSISQFLCIPMLIGVTTGMVRYNAESQNPEKISKILSTSYVLVIVFSLISIIIYFIFSAKFSQIFSISNSLFYLSIFFALVTLIYNLTSASMQSLHKIKELASIRAVYSFLTLSSFLIFIYFNHKLFESAIFSIYFSSILVILILILYLHKYFSFSYVDRQWMCKLLHYSAYGSFGSTSGIIMGNVDKLLINIYLTTADIGLYRAYYFASLGIASIVVTIFATVFFPLASKYKNKTPILIHFEGITPYLIIFGTLCIISMEATILKLYGSNYPINLEMILIFGITAVVFIFHQIYAWLISSYGINGARIVAIVTFFLSFLNILLNVLWIPSMGVIGAILAACVTYLCSTVYFIYKLKKGIDCN